MSLKCPQILGPIPLMSASVTWSWDWAHFQQVCRWCWVGQLIWGNAIQGGPYRLEEWLHVNIMKFNRPNTRFCTWAETAYRQGHKWIKSIPVRKDMGIMVSEKLNTNFPCGQKANYIVCFVKRKAWSAGQGRWFSPLCSALVTTPLQQCIELGGSQQKL